MFLHMQDATYSPDLFMHNETCSNTCQHKNISNLKSNIESIPVVNVGSLFDTLACN